MSLARVHTAQPGVLKGEAVVVDADLSRGLHSFTIVGLAGKAVDESKERVSAAIKNSGYSSPKSQNQRIIISMAPADIKKEGPLFDLPIAIAYLLANGDIKTQATNSLLIGELALDGSLRKIKGILPVVLKAKEIGFKEVILPADNAVEAALIEGIDIIPAHNLNQVISHIDFNSEIYKPIKAQKTTKIKPALSTESTLLDDIKGQEMAKRGLIIAAAGRHNALMVGPPGTGKTMLAKALKNLLPPLSREEALEVMSIHSLFGMNKEMTSQPSFRAPHHTSSYTALVGGGSIPKPGEVTLAHLGVLFMDEFPEFERRSLDALRQPLEDKVVSISRVQGTAQFPADFILLAAMNPYRGTEDGTTDYHGAMVDTYKNKISGPILDRIDLWLEVPHVDYETLTKSNKNKVETETKIAKEQIKKARNLMKKRYKNLAINTNDQLSSRDIEKLIPISDEVSKILKTSSQKMNLSPRSYHRLIKVSQTIADLEGATEIKKDHVL